MSKVKSGLCTLIIAGILGVGMPAFADSPDHDDSVGKRMSWVVTNGHRTIYAGQGTTIYVASSGFPGIKLALQQWIKASSGWQGWKAVAIRNSDGRGQASFVVKPSSTTTYRAALVENSTVAGSVSDYLRVTVKPNKGRAVVQEAMTKIGRPYVFGAAGPRAYDCSGLTLAVFRKFGIRLPHRATLQGRLGRYVAGNAKQPGDLLVFGRPGNYTHAAIYAGNGLMVEAPHAGANVRIHKIWSNRYNVRRFV